MSKESRKFPAVMTTCDMLGLEEGTILRFDWTSGKYVSMEELEDIADDYYYSGYAVAIDPYVVKDNIGECFAYIEEETKEKEKELPVEPVAVYTDKEAEEQLKSEAELKDKIEEPRVVLFNPLVVDCACGARKLLKVLDAPGVNITLMAQDEDSFIELGCDECGAKLKLWFATDDSTGYEPTKKESK